MRLIKTLREISEMPKRASRGFVPTMGALHEGHLSLVRKSKEENDETVVSIFVNPLQFGPGEDFHRYPRDLQRDLEKLVALSVDTVFMPEDREIYPDGFSTTVSVGDIGRRLCGSLRPGHFDGVATVVAKLFLAVSPDRAYFGQKDFQQTVVVRKLVRDLNFHIEVIVCPTVREEDGLAKSSRNGYLTPEERRAAQVLNRALNRARDLVDEGFVDALSVREEAERVMQTEPLAEIDYVRIVNRGNLHDISRIDGNAALCIAVRFGSTRLIDNCLL